MKTAMQMAIEHYENLSAQGSNQAYVIAKFLKEKFLPLEKQQILDAYWEGGENMAKKYFAETYGSKGSDETNGNNVEKVPNVTSSQTEISDEEIEKAAKEWYDKEGIVNYKAEIRAWVSACKWYREQLKNK